MANSTIIGIDIAKNNLQLHGVDANGKTVLKKRVSRDKFFSFMANLPKCIVGMEACGGAHYWAKILIELGFDVKLMSANKVKEFTGRQKNDAKDAQACAAAVQKEDMIFVSVRTDEQLEIQAMHRLRSHYVKERTALMNTARGLLLEYGVAIAQGQSFLMKKLNELLAEDNQHLSARIKAQIQLLYEDIKLTESRVAHQTKEIEKLAQEDEYCQRLTTISGVGPLTATAVVAKIGNGSAFTNGRELSAYFGLVPRQYSSGDKNRLLGITKHGDRYVRQLLVHGGRSSLQAALRKNKETGCYEKEDKHSNWARQLVERVGMNRASVALANKHARIILAVLKNESRFDPALAH